MVDSIVEAKKWPKSLPKITDREVAVAVGNLLLESQFFHQSEKQEKKGYLKVCCELLLCSTFSEHLPVLLSYYILIFSLCFNVACSKWYFSRIWILYLDICRIDNLG